MTHSVAPAPPDANLAAEAVASAAAAASADLRARAKIRLYVLCQTVGWGLLFAMQCAFTVLFSQNAETPRTTDPLTDFCLLAVVSLTGLLLTHYSRRFIERWNLKEKSWLALIPRVLGIAIVLSVLWNGFGFGFQFLVLDYPTSTKYPPALLFGVSVVNGAILLVFWFCAYFLYQLFDRFNRSEIERLRLANVAKESELRALKSQVNPHFIFNSLNSVRALIKEDPARARQAVTQLASLLRYSLQSGQLETVSFEDELAVVNDYLALEQVRHEERLRLRLEVAPETLQLPVPPMVLQTLVENAIKYGIATRPAGGEITIRTHLADATLHLLVTNPGTLAAAVATNSAAARPSTGLGLRNAESRLRLLFGDRARLDLRQAGLDLVAAEITVPVREADLARVHRGPAPERARRPVTV